MGSEMNKRQRESEGDRTNGESTDSPTIVQADGGEMAFEPGASAGSAESETLLVQIAQKDKEIAELKDKYLRALADGENARKRIRQQSEESIRLQREGILRDLLSVVDNLERAVSAARSGADSKSIVEGVELVLRSLHDFLRG